MLLRLFTDVNENDTNRLGETLALALQQYGKVLLVKELGTYWKMPQYLEFSCVLIPTGSVKECLEVLHSRWPTGWTDDVWNYESSVKPPLHQSVRWLSLETQEANAAPLFEFDEQVRVRDVPDTQLRGVAGVYGIVKGRSEPALGNVDSRWSYAIMQDGVDALTMFGEDELEAVGDASSPGR